LDITGYQVGTVPPFGHKRPLSIFIEARVLDQTEIYAGGGAINALVRMSTDELQRVTKADKVDLQPPAV